MTEQLTTNLQYVEDALKLMSRRAHNILEALETLGRETSALTAELLEFHISLNKYPEWPTPIANMMLNASSSCGNPNSEEKQPPSQYKDHFSDAHVRMKQLMNELDEMLRIERASQMNVIRENVISVSKFMLNTVNKFKAGVTTLLTIKQKKELQLKREGRTDYSSMKNKDQEFSQSLTAIHSQINTFMQVDLKQAIDSSFISFWQSQVRSSQDVQKMSQLLKESNSENGLLEPDSEKSNNTFPHIPEQERTSSLDEPFSPASALANELGESMNQSDLAQSPPMSPLGRSFGANSMDLSLTLEKVIEDPASLKFFAMFLEKDHSSEQLRFYLDVTKYADLVKRRQRVEEEGTSPKNKNLIGHIDELVIRSAQVIFMEYLDSTSPYPINTSQQVKEQIRDAIFQNRVFTIDVFDLAMNEVQCALKTDLFPRFCDSVFKRKMELDRDRRLILRLKKKRNTIKLGSDQASPVESFRNSRRFTLSFDEAMNFQEDEDEDKTGESSPVNVSSKSNNSTRNQSPDSPTPVRRNTLRGNQTSENYAECLNLLMLQVNKPDPGTWTVEEVGLWIEQNPGLGKDLKARFTDRKVDGRQLLQMTTIDLYSMGVEKLFHRIKILDAIKTLSKKSSTQ